MTSSRRSSAASLRRSTLTVARKSTLAPSVSVIHAEPERSSSPSGSAAAKLSPRVSLRNIQARKRDREGSMEPEESVSTSGKPADVDGGLEEDSKDQGSSKRARTDSVSELGRASSQEEIKETDLISPAWSKSWFTFHRTPSKQSLAVPEITQTVSATADIPLSESPNIVALNTPADAVEVNAAIAIDAPSESPRNGNPQNTSSSPGWFGSLSRAQRRVTREESKFSEPVANLARATDDTTFEGQSSNVDGLSVPPSDDSQSKSGSIWFTPQSPPRPQLEQSSSVFSTPVQHESSPPTNSMLEVELVSTHKSEAKLSTLPSSSRFTLSMPLLGRPKVPLDLVVARTDSETTVMPIAVPSETDNAQPGLSTSQDASTSDAPALIIRTDPDAKPIRSSWWDYIGLGGKAEASPTPSLPVSPLQRGPPNTTISNEAAVSSQQQPPEQQIDRDRVEGAETKPTQTEGISEVNSGRPLSVGSGQSSASAWYSPWGWYEWYTAPAALETPEVPTAPKTEAELVKEEALARPDPPSSSSAIPPAPVPDPGLPSYVQESPPEPINPIISSLAVNSKGWASFFSSRTLTTKLVTERGEKSDGEMEVMNVDDDANDTAAGPSSTTSCQATMSPIPVVDVTDSDSKPTTKKTLPHKDASNGKSKITRGAPLTSSASVKRKVVAALPGQRSASPTPSKKSSKSVPSPTPRPPNLVLPTFGDTFGSLPRSRAPPQAKSTTALAIKKTLGFVSNVLFSRDSDGSGKRKGKENVRISGLEEFGKELPRSWDVLSDVSERHVLASYKKIVVIGVHGWFPGYAMRTVLGEPTGTSAKFANMMEQAVTDFSEKHGIKFEEITKIPLEGEGKIELRVQKLYRNLTSNDSWMEALHDADVIFIATHSQGSIVSTHLISRLIAGGHIRTALSKVDAMTTVASTVASGTGGAVGPLPAGRHVQRVCCLALCGIHLGPLAYLHKNSFVMPYIQYFESDAAAELFEFQHTESQVSKEYVEALCHVLDHGVKLVYIASLNDQVVPVYSGAFTCATHPLILRALYIDGDAYHSSDFLSNLLVLLLRIRNAGLSDGGLLAHLSEATAGSLSGVGHSTAYEELATFSLAVDYLFLANDGYGGPHEFTFEPFNARNALNDYEIPWALRDLIGDERVVYLFAKEFSELRDAFDDWHPRTSILRDLKRKLEPIRRLKMTSRL